jgi:hypothetical protein
MLIGAAFVAAALVVSSLSTRTPVALLITGALSLLLIAATLIADSGSPAVQAVFQPLSVGDVLDDFAKGIVDSRHVVSCLVVALTSLSAYPMARSVTPLRREGASVASIIHSSDQTWSETDIKQVAAGHPSMDPQNGDCPGPVSLGVAVSTSSARVVVIGDSDFVANYSANVPGSAEIFLATVRWLSHEKIVTIAPRAPQERTLTMDGAQRKMLIFFAVLLLPGLAAAVAASIRIRA